MGAYISSAGGPPPDLPDDVIEDIIKRTATSTLFDSAIYVNKKWNDIGRRNAIWIPRYKQLTRKQLNPADYKEYEVFPLFMEEWRNRTPIYVDRLGKVIEKPKAIDAWIDLKRKELQSALVGKPLRVDPKGTTLQLLKEDSVARDYKDFSMLVTTELKNPEILWLVRQSGQRARLERDEDFYIVSPQNDLLGTRVEVVGQGSYNCAVLVELDNGTRQIVRIATLKDQDEWTQRAIPRGAAIIGLFNQYSCILGPSLVEEKTAGFFTDHLPEIMRPFLCESIANSPGPFYVHRLEYLDGKMLPSNLDSRQAQAFPLIWFLHVARNHFGFRHGDLKPANIVFRTYETPQRFTFRYNDYYTFSYEFTRVPVIIDYDFAAVYATRREDRNNLMGTASSIPPEIMWQKLHEIMSGRQLDIPEYDDWWSLGMVLFYYWTGISMQEFVSAYLKDYAEMIWTVTYCQIPSKLKAATGNHRWLGQCFLQLLSAYVLIRGLYEPGNMLTPPKYLRDTVYPPCVQGLLDSIPNYGILVSPWQSKLLRQLLDWEPRMRGQDLLPRFFDNIIYDFPDFEYRDTQPKPKDLEDVPFLKDSAHSNTCAKLHL